MLLFYKIVKETQMSTPPEATRQNNLTTLLVLLPLRTNSKSTLQYETPCILLTNKKIQKIQTLILNLEKNDCKKTLFIDNHTCCSGRANTVMSTAHGSGPNSVHLHCCIACTELSTNNFS